MCVTTLTSQEFISSFSNPRPCNQINDVTYGDPKRNIESSANLNILVKDGVCGNQYETHPRRSLLRLRGGSPQKQQQQQQQQQQQLLLQLRQQQLQRLHRLQQWQQQQQLLLLHRQQCQQKQTQSLFGSNYPMSQGSIQVWIKVINHPVNQGLNAPSRTHLRRKTLALRRPHLLSAASAPSVQALRRTRRA